MKFKNTLTISLLLIIKIFSSAASSADESSKDSSLLKDPRFRSVNESSSRLHRAAYDDGHNLENLIARCGIDSREDKFERSPLHIAILSKNKAKEKIIDQLLKAKADVNSLSKGRITPLQCACITGNIYAIRKLLDEKAKVDGETENGETALSIAIEKDFKKIALLLLTDNPDEINKPNKEQKTPLCIAAKTGNLNMVKLLVRHGADINFISPEGTPIQIAERNVHKNVLEFFAQGALETDDAVLVADSSSDDEIVDGDALDSNGLGGGAVVVKKK